MAEGRDPDAFVAAAEQIADDPEPTSGPLKAERLLIGHFPFMTTNEIRAAIGLGPLADGNLPSGEWLARHGVVTVSGKAAASDE